MYKYKVIVLKVKLIAEQLELFLITSKYTKIS